jgi:glycine cleavage system aminomethyltransferase T
VPVGGSYSSNHASHERTPFDLSWGRLINFGHDFIGKDALQRIANDPPHKFVSLEWNSDDVIDVFASLFRPETHDYMEMPRNGLIVADSVFSNGIVVGCATSRCYSYSFKRMISHCIIDTKFSEPGTELTLAWGDGTRGPQKIIRVVSITLMPYYTVSLS